MDNKEIKKEFKEVEDLRKWILYESPTYFENIHILHNDDIVNNDACALLGIKSLYSYLESVEKDSIDQNRVQDLLRGIPRLDVGRYADLKLSDEEKEFCRVYADNVENELKEHDESKIPNFFLKSYINYLLDQRNKKDEENFVLKKAM